MRKTSPEEIDKLYQFTRKHFVEHYDVQTELVDHLASAMDQNWEKEPEISFEENLQREFSKFGIFGFLEVVEEKTKAMGKKYQSLLWQEVKLLLSQPRTAFPLLLLFFLVLFLLKYETGQILLWISLLVYFSVLIFYNAKRFRKIKRKKKEGEETYLLESIILNTGWSFSFFWIPLNLFYQANLFNYVEHFYIQVPVAIFLCILMFGSYICHYELPQKVDTILKNLYPEIKFQRGNM